MAFMEKVKDVADSVVDAVEKGAKNDSDNSKKMAEKMRIKKDISKAEFDINSAYVEIGKKYFEQNADKPSDEYSEYISSIINQKMKVTELNKKLQALDNRTNCPNCGAAIDEANNFCDKCGAKIVKPAPESEESDVVEVVEAKVVDNDSDSNS